MRGQQAKMTDQGSIGCQDQPALPHDGTLMPQKNASTQSELTIAETTRLIEERANETIS